MCDARSKHDWLLVAGGDMQTKKCEEEERCR